MARTKKVIQDEIETIDINSLEIQDNVGKKKFDASLHQELDLKDDTEVESPTIEIEKKKFNLFEKLKMDQEENRLLDEEIISSELVEANSRSNKVERFNPTIEQGLTDEQIEKRKSQGLTNDNQKTYSKSYKQIFLKNIFSFFNILCVGVAIALIIVKSYTDLAFLAILTVNTFISIFQEINAKKTIDKLSIVTAPTSTVIRESIASDIPVTNIVLDDIVKLKNGKQISADCEIVDGTIEVNESLLTGEADAIKKTVGDTLFAGSFVTSGSCYAKVNRVGKDCYIQRLQAKAKRYTKPRSELLKSLRMVTSFIAIFIVPLGALTAYKNYQAAKGEVTDPTFGVTGAFNVYGCNSNGEVSAAISLNDKIKSETDDNKNSPIIIKFNNIDIEKIGIGVNTVDRIKIAYDSKINGNISISKVEVYSATPSYDPEDTERVIEYATAADATPIKTWIFDSSNAVYSDTTIGVVSSTGLSRYDDGTLKLDETYDYVTLGTFEKQEALQIRITLQSRAYDIVNEKEALDNAVLTKTITKTSGSIIGMIPAGLFLLVTVALAVSVVKLGKSKTLVQELYCIEMLARVDCICLDKTGTITDGSMRVKEVIDIAPPKPGEPPLETIVGAYLGALEDNNQTSIALQDKFGVNFEYQKVTLVPFSSVRKMSAVQFDGEGTYILGAPEFVYNGQSKKILSTIAKKAAMGYRVLMFSKSSQPIVKDKIPSTSSPICLIVLEDHIRPEATKTIKWFNENGVQIKVISGDNPATVAEIAQKVGIENAGEYISLEGLSSQEVETVAKDYTVFGRVTPDQKAILIKTLRRSGRTVAMTGDGVNDILAMKEADCSIAMASGSEAARNVSHLVLMDSNFANMPKVVLEGRRVINNIQRSSTLYLMKTLLTMTITILAIFATNIFVSGYPFAPRQFTILETFIIGIPSMVLALQPNKERIHGNFLSNVFASCLSQAICLVIPILIIFIIRSRTIDGLNLGSFDQTTSLCVIALTYTGFIILVYVCFH